MPKDNEIPSNAFALVCIPGEKERVYLPGIDHITYAELSDFLRSLAKLSAIVSSAMEQYLKEDKAPGDNFPRFNGMGDN